MLTNSSTRCLRGAVMEWYPHVVFTGDEDDPDISGFAPVMMDMVGKKLGRCIEYVVPADRAYGMLSENGSWSGVMGMLMNNEADFSAMVLSVDIPRALAVDFSSPLFMDAYVIAHQRPVFESDLAGFIKPFSALMWSSILVSMLLMGLAIFLIQLGYQRLYPPSRGNVVLQNRTKELAPKANIAWDSFCWTFGSIVAQASPWWPRKDAVRVVTYLWLIAALIVCTLYRSTLKAMLILPKLELPFNNLEELLKTDITTFVPESSMLHQIVKDSPPETSVGKLNQRLVTHADTFRAVRDLNEGKYAVFAWALSIYFSAHVTYERTRTCPIYIANERLFGGLMQGISFPKGSPLKDDMDPLLQNLKEFGILDHLFFKYLRHAEKCLNTDHIKPRDTTRAMNLESLYGVFSIYAGGMFLGILVFIWELLQGYLKKDPRHRSTTTSEIRGSEEFIE